MKVCLKNTQEITLFRKVLNNVNRFRKRYFTPQKMLPATASRLIELEGGAYASHLKDVEFSMKEFYLYA